MECAQWDFARFFTHLLISEYAGARTNRRTEISKENYQDEASVKIETDR